MAFEITEMKNGFRNSFQFGFKRPEKNYKYTVILKIV